MIEYRETAGTGVVEITVDGFVTETELRDIASRLEAFIKSHGKVRILEVIKDFGGMDPMAFWEDIKFAFTHLNDFSRCAVVTDAQWIEWWSKAVRPFLNCQVEVFQLADVDKAREWLNDDG